MRLKSLRLAGFKSYVDPTVIDLPHNVTVVVGPNGCGKSNIVDAIRLGIGESQASQLRGDELSDVIFEGTNERAPSGQASIELLFDNHDHKIGGSYAKYSEIALRREISQDSPSKFYLNGRRCRKRDIRDLFLGSGFGARSYSVIEQGFVGRIVTAKPEELRGHLEEVAGVSKYRDRRRETEKKDRGNSGKSRTSQRSRGRTRPPNNIFGTSSSRSGTLLRFTRQATYCPSKTGCTSGANS